MLSMCVRSINTKIWKLEFIVFCDCVMVLGPNKIFTTPRCMKAKLNFDWLIFIRGRN